LAFGQIPARGPTPNTGFIETSLGSHAVNNRKYVRVRPTLQLQEYEDIFALGDIIDWDEQKQISKAWSHAAIVAANVDAHLSGRQLKEYKGSFEMIVVTIGKVRLFCLLYFNKLV
jgi:apoptosis-inducing factor 2